jgi:predicted dehydrogenase
MTTQANLRLGIVGCGAHSHVHARAAQEVGEVEIVCACDAEVGRARAWGAEHGGEHGYGSIEAMLGHPDLDGVILCTWPNQHAAQIRICVSRGIRNILCEKALVTSAAEARFVRALVEQHGTNLVEASMHRHHPAIRRLESILAAGGLGAVDSVRAAFHNYEPEEAARRSAAPNWRNRAECGGGVPYDWMHYLVDACNHFNGGGPRRVFASGNQDAESGVIYRIYGMIEYDNGRIGILENSKLANFSNALQITCAHGILHLPIAWAIQGEVTITETHRKPDWDFIAADTHRIPEANAYALQLEDFCRASRGAATPLVPLRDSLVNAMTTDALVTSLREGRAVEVEPPDA